jgi:hypothetical protein
MTDLIRYSILLLQLPYGFTQAVTIYDIKEENRGFWHKLYSGEKSFFSNRWLLPFR